MADDVDQAQDYAERFTADALREHWQRQKIGKGKSHCEDCDQPIPEARRKAIPSCCRCVECQAEFEVAHPDWRTLREH